MEVSPLNKTWNYCMTSTFRASKKPLKHWVYMCREIGDKISVFDYWEGNDVWCELSKVRKIEGSKHPLHISIHQTGCVRISADLSRSCSTAYYSITDSLIFSQPEARAVFILSTKFLVFLGDWILTSFVLFLLERSLDFLVYACCEYIYKLLFYAVSLYSFDSKWTIDHFITSSEGVFGRCIKDMFC